MSIRQTTQSAVGTACHTSSGPLLIVLPGIPALPQLRTAPCGELTEDAAGEFEDYILVAPGFVDLARTAPPASRLSYESPLGSALLGCRAGDEVDVAAPDAVRRVRLVHVE